MLDPLERWAQYGEKPDYLGLLTFGGTVYTDDRAPVEWLIDRSILGYAASED
jgi:hypothetical protein